MRKPAASARAPAEGARAFFAAADAPERRALYLSPVGPLELACRGGALTCLDFNARAGEIPAAAPGRDRGLDAARRWLDAYFAGENPDARALALAPAGSVFQCAVWEILREIPYGAVTTYGAVAREAARRLGRTRMAAQAAGGAIGRNPIGIIIPCHRVIGADGALTGFGGGLAVKTQLLRGEGVHLPPAEFFIWEN